MNQLLEDSAAQFSDTCYPRQIQGDLRIILQIKDIFLRAYKLLEEYRRLVDDQMDFLTKEFFEDKILLGENEIMQLTMEVKSFEMQARQKVYQNEGLCQYLIALDYENTNPSTPVRMLYCRSPVLRTRTKYKYEPSEFETSGAQRESLTETVRAIMEIQNDIRVKARSLLDFYHDLFTLQLHFILIITQICSYCMPLVTESVGLIERIFFWSFRPEIDLVRRNADITDRLKDIYTSVQYLLNTLGDTVIFLKQRCSTQKSLEKTFNQKVGCQQSQKDRLLRRIHVIRQDLDLMDEENDRLIGLIVKSNPDFVNSHAFNQIAEYGPKSIICDYLDHHQIESHLKSPPMPQYEFPPIVKREVTNPPCRLKDKLMGRTKLIFEEALKKVDDPDKLIGKNIQTFRGGIVAELSEITSESSTGRRRSSKKEKSKRKKGAVTDPIGDLKIHALESIGEDLRQNLDAKQKPKRHNKNGKHEQRMLPCTIKGSGRMEAVIMSNESDRNDS